MGGVCACSQTKQNWRHGCFFLPAHHFHQILQKFPSVSNEFTLTLFFPILDLVSENWNYLTQGFFNFFGGFRLSEYLSDLFPKISWIKICRPNSKMIFMIPIIQFFFDKATDQRMEMEFSNFIWDENNLHTPLYKAEAATSRIILRLLHI